MADEDEWYESVGFETALWIIFLVWPPFLPVAVAFCKWETGYLRRLSLACYVLMWIYIVGLIILASFTQFEYVLEDIEIVFKIGIPLTYLLVVFETCCSSELEYIQNLSDATGMGEFLKTLRESQGFITLHAKCYHWETKTRTVYEKDSNGNSRSRLETYQEMVVTHIDAETYNHETQVDASPAEITDTKGASKAVTRVKLSKTYEFGDELTAQDFHTRAEAFRERNRDLRLKSLFKDIRMFF